MQTASAAALPKMPLERESADDATFSASVTLFTGYKSEGRSYHTGARRMPRLAFEGARLRPPLRTSAGRSRPQDFDSVAGKLWISRKRCLTRQKLMLYFFVGRRHSATAVTFSLSGGLGSE